MEVLVCCILLIDVARVLAQCLERCLVLHLLSHLDRQAELIVGDLVCDGHIGNHFHVLNEFRRVLRRVRVVCADELEKILSRDLTHVPRDESRVECCDE